KSGPEVQKFTDRKKNPDKGSETLILIPDVGEGALDAGKLMATGRHQQSQVFVSGINEIVSSIEAECLFFFFFCFFNEAEGIGIKNLYFSWFNDIGIIQQVWMAKLEVFTTF
ncbi:hypothetical protein ACJX0J_033014, partial [Zea mays]